MSRVFDAHGPFPDLAREHLADTQLRANLAHATTVIRDKRLRTVRELPDWEALRDAGAAIKDDVLSRLDELCLEVERNVVARGGTVHWARDAAEANAIVVRLVQETGTSSVVKVKSMATAEIELNAALEAEGITAYETDLAELIVQLGDDLPSHILVPAIHKNRTQIRDIFLERMGESGLAAPDDLTNEPADLAAAARAHLRQRFLESRVAISGANFLIADSGSLVVVESEGNGRMCLTLPETLISVVGVEKILPDWRSLGVFMQLLPRSSTGERMNPYTSIFTGPTPGDGPSDFHLVLIDNGRSAALRDETGRDVLRCIRCSACLNVCPVYERTGGHSYGNPYPGPIGAVLVPQLRRGARGPLEDSLPYASSLCGACFEACPVKIDIPRILVRLRSEVIDAKRNDHPHDPELMAMRTVAATFSSTTRFRRALAGARIVGKLPWRQLRHLPPPLSAWTKGRDAPLPAATSFREWFADHRPDQVVDTLSPRQEFGVRHSHPSPVPPERDRVHESGRDAVLGALRDARELFPDASTPFESTYRREGALDSSSRVELLRERLIDYRARVVECVPDDVARRIAEIVAPYGRARLVVPADLESTWIEGVDAEVLADEPPLSVTQLDASDVTISGCATAIAETGTIILDAGARQGRRVLSLIPDHLILVVEEDAIVETVPEAVARITPQSAQTWISGPSATSDIELERVEGVHGPRTLDVVIVRQPLDAEQRADQSVPLEWAVRSNKES